MFTRDLKLEQKSTAQLEEELKILQREAARRIDAGRFNLGLEQKSTAQIEKELNILKGEVFRRINAGTFNFKLFTNAELSDLLKTSATAPRFTRACKN